MSTSPPLPRPPHFFARWWWLLLLAALGTGLVAWRVVRAVGTMKTRLSQALETRPADAGASYDPHLRLPPGADAGSLPEIAATALFAAYEHDEAAANRTYKNKRFVTRGTVDRSKKAYLTSNIIVRLETGGEALHAYMDPAQREAAAALKPGAEVALACECHGKIVRAIVLQKCVLVPSGE